LIDSKTVEITHFDVDLNRNPVDTKKRKNHWKFLISEHFDGLNPYRTHREINEALRDSLLYIHHALCHTKNLTTKRKTLKTKKETR